ncbi:MAG: stage V sporulation protein S [Caldilineae bacterium]|nr:stage V sporulation protein S [Chloroflexota bacterium]MCB9176366.1 stage V sporulation protein S [Caldilineae bacterium]
MSDLIKVSASSMTSSVAGAIAGVIREQGHAEVQAIGASAVNQAVKAIAIAHGYLEIDGIDIACLPEFVEVEIGGQARTALRFSVHGAPADAPMAIAGRNGHAWVPRLRSANPV